MIRRRVRRRLLARLVAGSEPLGDECLQRSTLVFAPHPDDETLGCGGLVMRLRDRGTPVEIVFMTDGASSHDGDPVALANARRAEAGEAASRLGVAAESLHFLPHPDGALAMVAEQATADVSALLTRIEPAQVAVPHPAEPNRDHAATADIARRAVEGCGLAVDALLYPVWLWDQWPWTNPVSAPRGRLGRRAMVEAATAGRLGLGFRRLLGRSLDIGAVLERKRWALDAHQTQVATTGRDAGWLTLSDVAAGDWLELLLQPHELYGSTRFGDPAR